MHSPACRILEIIGLESDLYSEIKGQFGAHDFGAKTPRQRIQINSFLHPPPALGSSFCRATRACWEHWSTQKMKKSLEKHVEFFLIRGKEGNVPGNWLRASPPAH